MERNMFSRCIAGLCEAFLSCVTCTCDEGPEPSDEYRRDREYISTERTEQSRQRYQGHRERARRTAIHDAKRHQRTAHGFSKSNKRKAEPPKTDHYPRAAKRRPEESESSKLGSKLKHIVMTKCPLFLNNFQTSLSAEEFHRADVYRKQADECWERKNKLKKLGLFGRVKEQRLMMDTANHLAALTLLSENLENKDYNDTIDVHFLYEGEALQALDIFLDKEIRMLQEQKKKKKKKKAIKVLTVITGQGKHSRDRLPKLKPLVINRLLERDLYSNESEENTGRIIVCVCHDSKLTTDLKMEP